MEENKPDLASPAKRAAHNVAKFGAFEVQLQSGELCKFGARIPLQRRSFCVLRALLEEPGRVVTRDELRTRLWPEGTFVDFESGLNTAVNRLRSALGDSADAPIYIETLARLGYRFIAPVTLPIVEVCESAVPVLVSTPVPADPVPEVLPPLFAAPPNRPSSKLRWALAGVGAVLVLSAFTFYRYRNTAPSFEQLTFAREFIQNARFTPDGTHIVYSAAVDGRESRLYLTSVTAPNPSEAHSVDLGLPTRTLGGVSPKGDVAFIDWQKKTGPALRTVPLAGGEPRTLAKNAYGVDWSNNGTAAIISWKEDSFVIEYPQGNVIYKSHSWLECVRVSPHQERVAFIEHPIPNDDTGSVIVVEKSGVARNVSSNWESIDGLAWAPSGREVWFTAARSGVNRKLMAVNLTGRVRQVADLPGGILLRDISPDGKVLIARAASRMTMFRGNLNTAAAQDISWLDWSRAVAISADGNRVLFDESGQGGGSAYAVYLYDAAKKVAERLGEGRAIDLSADGTLALSENSTDPSKLNLITIKDHKSVALNSNGLSYAWARFFPGNCDEILASGSYPGKKPQLIRQHLPDGLPVLVGTDMGLNDPVISDSGDSVLGIDTRMRLISVRFADQSVRNIELAKPAFPLAFLAADNILTWRRDHGSLILEAVDLHTGASKPYHSVSPTDPVGTAQIFPIHLAADRQTFVYSRLQTLSTLFVVSGWT